jgi:hypothetical protein
MSGMRRQAAERFAQTAFVELLGSGASPGRRRRFSYVLVVLLAYSTMLALSALAATYTAGLKDQLFD